MIVTPSNPTPIRVLYLTINPNRASTTIPTEGWIKELVPRGLKPVLATSEYGEFSGWVEKAGYPCYTINLTAPTRSFKWQNYRSLFYLCWIVKRHGIQLLHCNEQNVYPIGAYLAKAMGLPIVVSIHFTMDRGFCEWAFRKHPPDRIVFVSDANRRNCLESLDGIVDDSKFVVINNGIDTLRNKPAPELRRVFREEHGISDSIALGVACALRPRKQIEHFIKALGGVLGNFRVFVAGAPVQGDEEYADWLISYAKESLGDRITFLGHQNDLRPMLNGIDLFVNTSQEEACSISVIEALAHGCPVIGYPSKSVDCQILPGGGEIIPQDDIQELSRCIQRWIDDNELRIRTSTTARNIAVDRFDMIGNCEQVWRLYQQILGKGVVG